MAVKWNASDEEQQEQIAEMSDAEFEEYSKRKENKPTSDNSNNSNHSSVNSSDTKYTVVKNGTPYHYADERTYKASLANVKTGNSNSSSASTQQSVGVQRSKSKIKKQAVENKESYTPKLQSSTGRVASSHSTGDFHRKNEELTRSYQYRTEHSDDSDMDTPDRTEYHGESNTDSTLPAIQNAASKNFKEDTKKPNVNVGGLVRH